MKSVDSKEEYAGDILSLFLSLVFCMEGISRSILKYFDTCNHCNFGNLTVE